MVILPGNHTPPVPLDKKPAAITPGKKFPPAVINVPTPSAPKGKNPPPVTPGMKSPPGVVNFAISPHKSSPPYQKPSPHPLMSPLVRGPQEDEEEDPPDDYVKADDYPFTVQPDESVNTAGVMHHIMYNMLDEKLLNGPIRSAFNNGGYIEPQLIILLEASELLTN